MPRNHVVLLSGGIDSAVILVEVLAMKAPDEAIYPLSFTYGARHNFWELDATTRMARYYGLTRESGPALRLEGSSLIGAGELVGTPTVVPGRNLVFLSYAAALCEARGGGVVHFGAHAGDAAVYPDCREEFVRGVFFVLQQSTGGRVQLHAANLRRTKAEVITTGARLGVPFELTYSCYAGMETHCGTCGACVGRREAFLAAGVTDPTQYTDET